MFVTVGCLVGYLWYSISLDKKKNACIEEFKFASVSDPGPLLKSHTQACEKKHKMHEGYEWQFLSNFVLICLSCGMYPFLVTAKDTKDFKPKSEKKKGGEEPQKVVTQIVTVQAPTSVPPQPVMYQQQPMQ